MVEATADKKSRFAVEVGTVENLPTYIPVNSTSGHLWFNVLKLVYVVLFLFLLDRATVLMAHYWLLESLGLEDVFWTNFKMGAFLYFAAIAGGTFAMLPAFLVPGVPPIVKRFYKHFGPIGGIVTGYLLCLRYGTMLIWNAEGFGEADPVFGNDLGFYVFDLPAYWTVWGWILGTAVIGLIVSTICSLVASDYVKMQGERPKMSRLAMFFGRLGTGIMQIAVISMGLTIALAWWLSRYDILYRGGTAGRRSHINNGPTYVDVTGFFCTLNDYHVTAIATIITSVLIAVMLGTLRKAFVGNAPEDWRRKNRLCALGILAAIGGHFLFAGVVAIRQNLFVAPDQPVIQLPYIEAHINATRKAYNLDEVEVVRFVPKVPGDPLPTLDEVMETETIKNLMLWPGFTNWMEPRLDLENVERILTNHGQVIVYGPSLEYFRQRQQIRLYYNFLDVDTDRYDIDGEKRLVINSVREIPLFQTGRFRTQPWAAYFGQENLLFTHGWGMSMALPSEINSEGEPAYLPTGALTDDEPNMFGDVNERVYYGEGSGAMAYTNVQGIKEFDKATEEGRQEYVYPKEIKSGIHMDSFLKRMVFGWRSRAFWDIVMSGLINNETRIHYYRTPLQRLGTLAPFLYIDSDPWCVYMDDRLVWMVNCMTTTDRYPYSRFEYLGDKSMARSHYPHPHRRMNYVRDAVKVRIDAFTGETTLYKIADEPIVNAWSEVYPSLFKPAEEMSDEMRKHLRFPQPMFHTMFDDQFEIYHMDDPMTYFNMEDIFDDADEVMGPVRVEERIRWSIEPYEWLIDTGEDFPAAKDSEHSTQFAKTMVFTNYNALNLRAIVSVYQDGEDYGRMVSVQVPKGIWHLGPEQADALFDQNPEISEQIGWWQRHGSNVIRGHTMTLLIKGDVFYVEPIFIRSQQNRFPQMKRVMVVFRGHAKMGKTVEETIAAVLEEAAKDPPNSKDEVAAADPARDFVIEDTTTED